MFVVRILKELRKRKKRIIYCPAWQTQLVSIFKYQKTEGIIFLQCSFLPHRPTLYQIISKHNPKMIMQKEYKAMG